MDTRTKVVAAAGALVALGLIAHAVGWNPPTPPEWLVAWTSWLATALGILVIPGVLIDAAISLRRVAVR